MSLAAILSALALPPAASVGRRVPKTLLLENGAPTAADKRLLRDAVAELRWLAVLKPANLGVPAFQDAARDYSEIQILHAMLHPAAKRLARVHELIHRAVPYPALLLVAKDNTLALSLAHKRRSQTEKTGMVLDGAVALAELDETPITAVFHTRLAVHQQPAANFLALYQGWLDQVTALLAARITGTFADSPAPAAAAAQREALAQYAARQRELTRLRAQARREKSLAARVTLNLEIKRHEAGLAGLAAHL